MKTSKMFKLLQNIRALSITLSYGAILEMYHNNTIVKDIIRELQAN